MIKNAQDLRGKTIPDILEKRLIIARYFIKQRNADKDFSEIDMFYMWNNYFPSDFRVSKNRKLKLKKGKHYSQLVLEDNDANIPEKLIKNYSNKWERIYCWIVRYFRLATLEKCDNDIRELRKKQYNELIRIFKPLTYYVRDTSAKEKDCKVAEYSIFSKGKQKSGSYSKLVEYAETVKKVKEG